MTSQAERFMVWRWSFYTEEMEPFLSDAFDSLAHCATRIVEVVYYAMEYVENTAEAAVSACAAGVLRAWIDAPSSWKELRGLTDGAPWRSCLCLLLSVLLVVSLCFRSQKHRERPKKAHQLKSGSLPKRRSLRSDELYARAVDMAKMAYESAMAERLITIVSENKLDVNRIIPGHKLSIFLAACLSGKSNTVRYLLTKGVDLDQTSAEGDPPMYLATYGILNSPCPDLAILSELAHHGADVNAKNTRGYTPLHRAASRGNIKVIKLLLDLGADPYIRNSTGTYPLDSAVNAGHLEAGELLCIELEDRDVWDIVEPYTPPRVRLGLQSPDRRSLMESTKSVRSTPAIFRRREQ